MSGRTNPGGHGWTKSVAPPKPGSRPKGLPPKPKGVIHVGIDTQSDQPGQGDQGSQQSEQQFTREDAEAATAQEQQGDSGQPQGDPTPSEPQGDQGAQDSQQEPQQDSNLQTPQPDQAIPSGGEATKDASDAQPTDSGSVSGETPNVGGADADTGAGDGVAQS